LFTIVATVTEATTTISIITQSSEIAATNEKEAERKEDTEE
jgi:hypothetical protein